MAENLFEVEFEVESVVSTTDAKYRKPGSSDLKPAVDFFCDVGWLIFDSMRTFGEGLSVDLLKDGLLSRHGGS